MAAFEYLALDPKGAPRNGVITAPDETTARQLLERRRLAPVRLTPANDTGPGLMPNLFKDRLKGKDLSLVTRQLSTLVSVTPLEEALRAIAQNSDQPKVRAILGEVHAGVREGYRLSEAMGRAATSFPPLYRAMVAAGEASGSLPAILERLADLLEQEQAVKAKLATALVYPIALAITAILVVIALLTFVVPKVVDQFDSMGQTLPLLTRIIIGISHVLGTYGWILATLLVIGALAFAQGLRSPGFRLAVDGGLLRLPVIGRLLREANAARLARTLSTMLASGLPVLEGLTLTARTVENRVLRRATEEMAISIREGGGLSAALRKAAVFPPVLLYMAASGESSGRLEMMLSKAADYLEREFNTFTSAALSLLEPAIIIVMGAVVATIVLSILLPILQINTLAIG
ncbi:type II secretion system inner membrane protein GspF [Caulobacter sp. SLTY]|uniref:type II secretion system inner membrane protein GspF n=1 Tax=Caulobacter sp. SLTY TaxID=2683262 RepID=UPI001412FD5A|nr:type II secretion system inner membrane protein GspF [Caulobacter sp. SLTY]NBB14789.1 type II secretion system inner membrane protein GspF [Caulobacter sp. SLTY]